MGERGVVWRRAVLAATLAAGVVVSGQGGSARADDPPPAPEPPVLRQFTMSVSGDVIALPVIYNRAKRLGGRTSYDFSPMFADITPLVSSVDLSVCHLEVPVAPAGAKPTGYPRWSSPPSITDALAGAGFDRCSTASNHTLDKGVKGIDATLNALDAAGLAHSGSARTPEEAIPDIFETNGVRIVHLSYTFGFNGFRLPKDQPWRSNRIDLQRIIADATAARARGAEVVLLSMHWGLEGRSRPTKEQRALATALTASGVIDLIIGHHSHVLQPIEQINGRWVLFGLGNLLSDHRPESRWPAASEDGAIVTLTVSEREGGGFDISRPMVHPTWSQPVTFVPMLALAHQNDPALRRSERARLNRSLTRTRRLLGGYFPVPVPATATVTLSRD